MSEIRKLAIKGVYWSVIERFSVQGVMFLTGIVMARLLTPSDFGVIGMLSIFISISQTFIDSGFSNALIRKNDRKDIDFSTAFYFNVVIGAVCYFVLYLLAPFIADFYNMSILKDVTRVLAVTLFFNSFTIVQVALLTIKIDFRTQAKINLTGAVISGALGITLAYTGWGVWALVYQTICRSALIVILYWILVRWTPGLQFSWISFNNLFSFGSKLLLSGLLHTFYLNITNLVIGKFYSSKDLGYFERGNQFGKIPIETSIAILQRVTFPILATIQDDEKKLIQSYRKYIKLSSVPIFFLLFLLIALAKPIVIILLTDRWAESIIYLQLYCLAQVYTHITRINLNLLQVKGRSDLFLKLEIIKKSISLTLLAISVPFGIIAICISQIIYAQIALYINTYYTGKLFGLSCFVQISDFAKYFVAAILSCLPVFMMTLFDFNLYICIVAGPLLSLFIYCIILYNDEVFSELRLIVMNGLKG